MLCINLTDIFRYSAEPCPADMIRCFGYPDVSAELVELYHKFVVVQTEKASNKFLFVFKTLYLLLNGGAWCEYNNREPGIQTRYVA